MKRRSMREVSVKVWQYDTEGPRADVRDIEIEARGLVDYFLAVEDGRADDVAAFGRPSDADRQRAGVYLASVFARVTEAIRTIAAELYERHGMQNIPVAGPAIVGDIYCVVDYTHGIPDPRGEETLAPAVGIAVHKARAKFWAGEVERLLALITELDAGRATSEAEA